MISNIENEVICCLCTALNDTSSEVRFFAAKSLGLIRSKSPIVVENLRYTLQSDEDGKVRKAAESSLEIIRRLDDMIESPKVIMNIARAETVIGVKEAELFSKTDASQLFIDIKNLLDNIAQEKVESNLPDDLVNQMVVIEASKAPGLKKRLKSAIIYGGFEFVKTIFSHPIISVPIEIIRGFIEAD